MTDDQWKMIGGDSLPPAGTGRSLFNRSDLVDGVLRILEAGASWREFPEGFGKRSGLSEQVDKWIDDGALD